MTTKRENVWFNLLFNIILPSLILSKMSDETRLGPVWSLAVALSLPILYALYDLYVRRKWNFMSGLGLVSVLASGSLGLVHAEGKAFAIKEAVIPLLFGIFFIFSAKTDYSPARLIFHQENIFDLQRLDGALALRGTRPQYETLLTRFSYGLSLSFFLSAVLNFVLARILLVSPSGTPEFNAELGKMTLLSWPVIVVPSLAMTFGLIWWLVRGIYHLTGLHSNDLFLHPPKKAEAKITQDNHSSIDQ